MLVDIYKLTITKINSKYEMPNVVLWYTIAGYEADNHVY